MKITVNISRTNQKQTIDMKKGSKIQDVLSEINMKPDTLIVLKEDKPVPIDDDVKDRDDLTILKVSSGG